MFRNNWHVVLPAMLATACIGGHPVELEFHSPAACTPHDGGVVGDAGAPPVRCPLAAMRGVRVRVERVDGTIAATECTSLPASFCSLDDLTGLLLLPRVSAGDGLELQLTGWTAAGCGGALALECDSLGGGAISLGDVDSIPLFCQCPYVSAP